ncbi:MAG: glycosyltransferase [Bryobacteraceae bacterium]|nr:glycosyltransferase [Bryobacteraceae bacterium]
MQILLVSNVFPPGFVGGFELGALEVAKGLADRGHDVQVLTSDYFLDENDAISGLVVNRCLRCVGPSHEGAANAQVQRLGVYHDYANLRRVAYAIRRQQPHVLLLFNIQGLGALSLMTMLSDLRMPTVVYMMDSPLVGLDSSSSLNCQYRKIFGQHRLSDCIRFISMSEKLVLECSAALDQTIRADAIVPAWIHEELLTEPPEPEISSEVVRFAFCSRIAPHKGTDIVLDGAELLARDGVTNFVIDVFGDGQVAQFLQSVRARGLDRFVHYRGSRPKWEMQKLFRDYHALLFPTWEREPFGFVVSEAAAAGCVPIMTRGIGAGDWFFHEVDCIKIERSGHHLRQAMYMIAAMPVDARMDLRLAALGTARRLLPFRYWLPKIEDVCHIAASRGRPVTNSGNLQVLAAYQFLGQLWNDTAA